MADAAQTTAPKKTRKAQGPRQSKPLYGVISYIGDDGQPQRLDKSRLTIDVHRDASAVMDLLESGTGNATVVRINLPAPAQRAATPAAQG